MKVAVDCKTRRESQAIRRALADPACRAAVLCVGYLLDLSSDRARLRTLRYVADVLDEEKRRASASKQR